MKYALTLGALALTFPTIGMAQAAGDQRQDRDQQQTQQSPGERGQAGERGQSDDRGHAGASERADQQSHDPMGRRTSENRLTHMEQDHIKLDDLKDTSIVNRQDEEIGTVSDIILDQQGRVAAVVVTSGGMLGIGSKTKALSWDDVQVRSKSGEDDEYEIVVGMSEQEFENLPEFEAERRTTGSAR